MLPHLSVIRDKRKKLGWTQKKLASRSGVSQSTIAKIERGMISPSYNIVRRIFTALEEGERNMKGITAREIMTREVITVSMEDTIKKVRILMKEYAISQIPVLYEGRIVGMITESNILDAYSRYGKNAQMAKVGEFMGDMPPTVPPDARISTLVGILKQYPAVIVSDENGIKGIITRADLVYWG